MPVRMRVLKRIWRKGEEERQKMGGVQNVSLYHNAEEHKKSEYSAKVWHLMEQGTYVKKNIIILKYCISNKFQEN